MIFLTDTKSLTDQGWELVPGQRNVYKQKDTGIIQEILLVHPQRAKYFRKLIDKMESHWGTTVEGKR